MFGDFSQCPQRSSIFRGRGSQVIGRWVSLFPMEIEKSSNGERVLREKREKHQVVQMEQKARVYVTAPVQLFLNRIPVQVQPSLLPSTSYHFYIPSSRFVFLCYFLPIRNGDPEFARGKACRKAWCRTWKREPHTHQQKCLRSLMDFLPLRWNMQLCHRGRTVATCMSETEVLPCSFHITKATQ